MKANKSKPQGIVPCIAGLGAVVILDDWACLAFGVTFLAGVAITKIREWWIMRKSIRATQPAKPCHKCGKRSSPRFYRMCDECAETMHAKAREILERDASA